MKNSAPSQPDDEDIRKLAKLLKAGADAISQNQEEPDDTTQIDLDKRDNFSFSVSSDRLTLFFVRITRTKDIPRITKILTTALRKGVPFTLTAQANGVIFLINPTKKFVYSLLTILLVSGGSLATYLNLFFG